MLTPKDSDISRICMNKKNLQLNGRKLHVHLGVRCDASTNFFRGSAKMGLP